MGVLVDETTRVMVQGITGKEGSFHARGCMAYGTNVVAGVPPGRGGTERGANHGTAIVIARAGSRTLAHGSVRP